MLPGRRLGSIPRGRQVDLVAFSFGVDAELGRRSRAGWTSPWTILDLRASLVSYGEFHEHAGEMEPVNAPGP